MFRVHFLTAIRHRICDDRLRELQKDVTIPFPLKMKRKLTNALSRLLSLEPRETLKLDDDLLTVKKCVFSGSIRRFGNAVVENQSTSAKKASHRTMHLQQKKTEKNTRHTPAMGRKLRQFHRFRFCPSQTIPRLMMTTTTIMKPPARKTAFHVSWRNTSKHWTHSVCESWVEDFHRQNKKEGVFKRKTYFL